MSNLTVLLENVEKPHNLSAILRTCDAVGILEAHAVCKTNKTQTFNTTAQGSQKWVRLNNYPSSETAIKALKDKGFQLYGTNLGQKSFDYRECDFIGPTAFVLGAEKWGLSDETTKLMDKSLLIPMRGMVQSLNVSVAAATLLFEALRQRNAAVVIPKQGEGLTKELYNQILFEWSYPEVASWCKIKGREYPLLSEDGEIIENLPRTIKLRY